ncbi:Pleckstrin homology domain-containing family O member 2 [Tupaia chinensis]|uniref:Pleckstrin homology domain-containing family O member 2 n=1 Tax=Tupaia chinensis TaxID=246437 RepID=L9L8J2_TUPCH|nr:Pleckstrin homology domain-containing family O member 2 [Tupaia chinensis]
MEDEGTKEGGEKPRGARTADKAGWIKKSSGGLLSLWKDRYLLLCQAQLLVYENEDEQKCVETVELGSYEKCQDLRALLKRKHRFILLRSPGNKVSDIKFQAPSGEEKESWIKALNEGINRGKNKAFDEVKVDKSCALEHVTRDRVRGGQRRRPPTRVHLKEVASAASDGLLRLDLDVPDSGPPVLAPSGDDSAAQPRETPRPLMPPTKSSPVPEMTSLGDRVETSAGERAPSPVSASPEVHPDSQEDSETPAGADGGSEQPPNSVLSDKLKTSEAAAREGRKPPTPPPKILSEKLKARMSGMEASGPAPSPGAPEASAPDPAQVSVNGVDDSPEPAQPAQATGSPGVIPKDALSSVAQPPQDLPLQFHPRCSSLGDLLGEGPPRPRQPRELAETLLSQAVEQLRQATRVLQEMRDSGEPSPGAPGLREKRKELVTLYRRSAP